MVRRKVLPALSFALSLTMAQTGPADLRAYNAAIAIADPEKKIEALAKIRTDFPDSDLVRTADQAILATLVKKQPSQTQRIRKVASGMYRREPEAGRGALANQIALQFFAADLLLKDASDYARKSIDAMVLSSYVNGQIEAYRERGQTPPWTRDLEERFRDSRALRLATLGRIELKRGNTEKSRRLLEEAHAALPENATIQTALGELAARQGNNAKALEHLSLARLSGQYSKETTSVLEAVYRKLHGGSVDGLEDFLDREYRRRFPNPIHLDAYQQNSARGDRLVLAEVFTGSGCGPCAAANLAFDAAMERYSRKALAVVMYHQHIPRPDPMTNSDTQARYREFGEGGVPALAIDGKKTIGGGTRDMAKQVFDRLNADIEKQLATPSEASLKLDGTRAGNSVSVKATVDAVRSDSKDLRVQIVLVEKLLRFSGESGIRFHPMVVRAIRGFKLDASGPGVFEHSFDIDDVSRSIKTHLDTFELAEKKDRIDRDDLALVAFVQDDKTKHVLQAAYVDLSPGL